MQADELVERSIGAVDDAAVRLARNLAGAPPRLDLYCERAGGAVGEVARVELRVDEEVTAAIGASPAFVLASLWVLLARHTGQTDIVALGRFRAGGELLPARGPLDDDPPFAAVVERAAQAIRDADADPAGPAAVTRAAAQLGLELEFEVALAIGEEGAAELLRDPGLPALKLVFTAADVEGILVLAILFDRGRFTTPEVERLLARWGVLIRAAAAAPTTQASRLPVLPAEERREIVSVWNDTAHRWPLDACVHALVDAQVTRTPERIAVVSEEGSLSYSELQRRADIVARALRRRGVTTETLVAICAERSLELIVGLLGILKAGAAYVPLDPDYPRERHAFMLADSAAPVLLTQRRLVGSLPEFAGEVLVIDELPESGDSHDMAVEVSPDNLVYVMYTSGSTGRPKGVMNIHRGVVNRLLDMQRTIPLTADDRLLQKTPCGFDISVYEFFWPLLAGATLVMARPGGHKDPAYLREVIASHAITTIHFVPPMLATFLEHPDLSGCGSLRRVLCTGDILPPATVQRCLSRLDVELWNLYGPTEAAIEVTAHRCDPRADTATVPIGKPIANSTIHILDRHGEPVPPGAPGELFIGGVQVARGYWRRPELTAERFVPDPFAPGGRLYRTGDLARRRLDGTIEFLGRLDHQVKIRGFRVEPGEVEATIRGHQAVREVVVVVREDVPGDRRLIAYVALDDGAHLAAIREALGRQLPAYMIPSAFVILERIPLLPNGKVDRKALPRPETREGALVTPRTPTESRVAAIWAEVIGAAEFGVTDAFLAIGGHSLHAAKIIARLRREYGCEISFAEFFARATVAEIARMVDERTGAAQGSGLGVEQGTADGPRPLSFAEERLYFLHRLAPESAAYHVPFAFRITGECDEERLARALRTLMNRHEILRTRFVAVEGVPRRVVEPAAEWTLECTDLSRSEGEREGAVARLLASEAARPFDLSRLPLVRGGMVRLGPSERVLWLVFHHIVTDGWSSAQFFAELKALYAAADPEDVAGLPRAPFSYADYAAWQRTASFDRRTAAALGQWKRRLAGAPGRLELAADRPRPEIPLHRGARLPFALSREELAPLQQLARECGATLSMALLAVFAAVLRRVSGQEELIVGLTAAARSAVELEHVAGFFVNTLPIRVDFADGPRLADVVARVREATLAAYQGDEVPFERIVQALQLPRDPTFPPLVQVAFAPQPRGESRLELRGCEVVPLDVHAGGAIFDLTLMTWETDDGGLRAALEYSTDLFDRWRIEVLADAIRTVVSAVREAVTVPTLPLFDLAQQRRQIAASCGPMVAVELGGGVHRFFEQQAARTPGAPAVIFGREVVGYAELDRRAARLARRLRAAGVGPDALVGIVAEREISTMVGVLAILKAGGAYVPLDPTYPAERLGFILADAGLRWIVARETGAAALPPHTAAIVDPEAGDDSPELPAVELGAQNLAYVLYTSGSTGRPKGVAMGHGALRNLTQWHVDDPRLGRAARTLQFASLGFDVSFQEIMTTWATGGAVVLVAEQVRRDALALLGLIERHAVERLFLPFVFLQQLAETASTLGRAPASLTDVVTAGEQLKITPAIRWMFGRMRDSWLHNHYGPTEAHVVTSHVLAPPAEGWPALPPIGTPIANVRIYVLDPGLRPVPPGVAGELYIAGAALARGYLARPELTAGRFVDDPFVAGEGMYRTGDLARRTPDGCVEYLGRVDFQVKLRGVRVELGEVEAILAEHASVAAAAAIVREDDPGEKRLVAYVSPRDGQSIDSQALRAHMRARAPEPMVPSAFVVLERLPLLPNGKVDRRALPAPAPAEPVARAGDSPRSALEQAIAAIWRELLHLERVGLDEPFFDLGGHSLLLAQVQAALLRRLRLEVSIVDMFRYSTIRSLAAHLSGTREAEPAVAPRAPVAAGDERAIAIVGMAGRFPGARSVEELWRRVCAGEELISFFTPEEVEAAGMDPAIARSPRFVPAIGVMPEAMCFDAAFFGYSPREARLLDPQQRVLLEVAWAALEDAGHAPRDIARPVGVFAGCEVPRYWLERIGTPGGPLSIEEYEIGFGNMNDTLATRVSYELGLRGPAFTIQTACSTSLVAVHVACRSILAGECDMALAGGSVVMPPDRLGHVSEGGSVVSPDGHCRPFDADAQGIVGGNGVAVVVLKRLADAIADGDHIRAVIRATAINNDGARKVGFTAPSVPGQCEVIEDALAAAGVDPATIGLVEAHGTATRLGDPIEVAALTQAYRKYTDRREYCALGSIKGNIGHLGAAAGVTGLIKAALALQQRCIPPTLHFRRPNPDLALDSSPFFVNAAALAWPRAEAPRRAAVSSFGVGGTNAHAILEEAPEPGETDPSRPVQLLVMSAKTPAALDAGAQRLAERLGELDGPLADVAHTLARGRVAMAHRRVVVARDATAAARALRDGDKAFVADAVAGSAPRVAFLFPGGGTQQLDMGRELYASDRVYRRHFDAAAECFAGELGLDVRATIFAEGAERDTVARALSRPTRFLPAIFCTEYALAMTLMNLGVVPVALTGHSLGEYTAATIAGVLSLADAARLLAERARLHESMTVAAALLAVPLAEGTLRQRLGAGLDIAAVNAADSCVVAGEAGAIARLESELSREGIECKKLPVTGASHCALVEPLLPRLRECAGRIGSSPPAIPIVSNVTGDWLTEADARDPGYWARHLRGTVRFADGLARLLEDRELLLLEVGPGRTLAGLTRRHPAAKGRTILGTMAARGGRRSDCEEFVFALANLWCRGVPLSWERWFAGERRRRVPLPTYAFERAHHEHPVAPVHRGVAAVISSPPPSPARAVVAAPAAALDPVERAVQEVVSEVLGIDAPSLRDNFFDLGGSSFLALRVRVRLEERLGVKLPVHAFVECPVLADLATFARKLLPRASGGPSDARPPASALAVTLRAGAGRDLYLIQPIGGTVFTYLPLAARLEPSLNVIGLRASGMEPNEPIYTSLQAIAGRYVAELRDRGARGPYLLGGHSAGGVIAFEMARQLLAQGEAVDLVALLDTSTPQLARRIALRDDDDVIRIAELMRSESSESYERFAQTLRGDPRFRALVRATWGAIAAYEPALVDVDALYVKARVQGEADEVDADLAWMRLFGGSFTRASVDADHFSMMDEPMVRTLAALLSRSIRALAPAGEAGRAAATAGAIARIAGRLA